ncbi:MAG: diguanylate cyclase [Gammaproteobacteria bacterium]|nr:diguanylate cyclase [Gammaproteobacteria bacterium]
MSINQIEFQKKLLEFIDVCNDGYAILTADDKLLGCNQSFADIFYQDLRSILGIHFDDLMRRSFEERKGIRIEAEDINLWLQQAHQRRRQNPFRIFEVDLIDGRWFLMSEQLLASGEILLQAKEITKQKVLEDQLHSRVATLSELALTDELTKIANRRCFVESTNTELGRCQRLNLPSALLLLDLDFFKSVNDLYGHQAGDEVLKATANRLKKALREYDIFGRIGGEEFAVFLSETSPQTALQVAERVRSLLANYPIKAGPVELCITVSIGIALCKGDSTFEDLYNQADSALYAAKRNGRNRAELYKLSSED